MHFSAMARQGGLPVDISDEALVAVALGHDLRQLRQGYRP